MKRKIMAIAMTGLAVEFQTFHQNLTFKILYCKIKIQLLTSNILTTGGIL